MMLVKFWQLSEDLIFSKVNTYLFFRLFLRNYFSLALQRGKIFEYALNAIEAFLFFIYISNISIERTKLLKLEFYSNYSKNT